MSSATMTPTNSVGSYSPSQQDRAGDDFSPPSPERQRKPERGNAAIRRGLRKTSISFETFGRALANSAMLEAQRYATSHKLATNERIDLKLDTTLHILADPDNDSVQVWVDTPSGRIGCNV